MKYLSVLGDTSEIVIKKLLDQWKSKEQPISKNERLVVMTITIKNLLVFLLIWFCWVGTLKMFSQSIHNFIWKHLRDLDRV